MSTLWKSTINLHHDTYHFWWVRTSQPISFSFFWMRLTYASIPSVLNAEASSAVCNVSVNVGGKILRLHEPAVTAFRCRPAKEMSWRTKLYTM